MKTKPLVPVKPKNLLRLKKALSMGYVIDTVHGKAYKPDGSEWPTRIDNYGYPSLQLNIKGEYLHIRLHKAVAYMLWGENAFGGNNVHVRHLDGDKSNCKQNNLALGSAQQNNLDKPKDQRSQAAKKRAETLGAEKLSEIAKRSMATLGREASVMYGRKSGAARKKLTPEQVLEVRENALKPPQDRIKQRDLAAMLGVKQGTICDILAGRCYADIQNETRLGNDRGGV